MSNYEIVSFFSLESDSTIASVRPFLCHKAKPLKQNRLRSIIPSIIVHCSSFSVIITLKNDPPTTLCTVILLLQVVSNYIIIVK